MIAWEIIVVTLSGYLIGSVSFAVILARRHGVDILAVGSGNPGATNVKRVVGRKAGNLVFLLDFLKGVVATGWPLLAGAWLSDPGRLALIGMISAIIGHSFSVFLRFRGGKGVAVTMGGLLVLVPLSLLIGLLVWVGVFFASGYVSLASILFALSLPLSAAIAYGTGDSRFAFVGAIAALIVYRHRANMGRLVRGEENRFTRKGKRDG